MTTIKTIAVLDKAAGTQFVSGLDFFNTYLSSVQHNGVPRYQNLGEVVQPAPPMPAQSTILPPAKCRTCGG